MLLNKNNLRVAEFAGKEESRYALQAVQCGPEGTVATNGHVLVHVTLPEAEDANFPSVGGFEPAGEVREPFLVSRDMALALAKSMPTKERIPILNHVAVGKADAEGRRQFAHTDLERPQVMRDTAQAGTFLEWQRCVPAPDAEPLAAVVLDAVYLAQVAKAAKEFQAGSSQPTVLLRLFGAEKAVTLEAYAEGTGQKFLAVVMPIRDGDMDGVFRPKRAAAAAEPVSEPEATAEPDAAVAEPIADSAL